MMLQCTPVVTAADPFTKMWLLFCRYIPSYDNSGVLIEGYKKGCNYVQGDCTKNSPGLEEVFCWDDRPSSEQDNICTPDHKSIGYCRSGMTLMNGCSVISPYQNTDCTNPEHGQSGLSVDMGTRHQTGARSELMKKTASLIMGNEKVLCIV